MSATFWDSFDNLLEKAEKEFLNFKFAAALEGWSNYYRITAKKEYKRVIEELEKSWEPREYENIPSVERLFQLLQKHRTQYMKKELSTYTFELLKKLLIKIYQERFRSSDLTENSLANGTFEYLCGNNSGAIKILSSVLENNTDSVITRAYLGHTYLSMKDHRQAIALLSQNLILAADEISEDDLYLSQFKLLYGRLFSECGHAKEAAWLLAYESWYRNWLIFSEDKPFFRLIQNKEMNERILQVKYYAYERIRHFMRCLFLSEYTRLYSNRDKGLIQEQEKYMSRLDVQLFERYRKKSKKTITAEKQEF